MKIVVGMQNLEVFHHLLFSCIIYFPALFQTPSLTGPEKFVKFNADKGIEDPQQQIQRESETVLGISLSSAALSGNLNINWLEEH